MHFENQKFNKKSALDGSAEALAEEEVTFPELSEMQRKALHEAVAAVRTHRAEAGDANAMSVRLAEKIAQAERGE